MSRALPVTLRTAGLGRIADQVVRHLTVNTAWAVTSLTVIGAPAATAALNAVVKEWAAGDERPVLGRFAAGLGAHWRRATLLAALTAPVLAVLAVNLWLAPMMGPQGSVVTVAVVAVAVPVALLVATLPSALTDAAGGLTAALSLAARRMVTRPLLSAAAVLLALGVAFSGLALPPLLLVTPSLAVWLHRAHVDRGRPTHPERTPA